MTTITKDSVTIHLHTTSPIETWTGLARAFGQIITLLEIADALDERQLGNLSPLGELAIAVANLDDKTRILLEESLPERKPKPYHTNED